MNNQILIDKETLLQFLHLADTVRDSIIMNGDSPVPRTGKSYPRTEAQLAALATARASRHTPKSVRIEKLRQDAAAIAAKKEGNGIGPSVEIIGSPGHYQCPFPGCEFVSHAKSTDTLKESHFGRYHGATYSQWRKKILGTY